MNVQILDAYGIIDKSPVELSQVLKTLNVSHTCVSRYGMRFFSYDVQGTAKEQPAWPIVIDSVRTLSKFKHLLTWVPSRAILFVVDARAALCQTNLNVGLWSEFRQLSMERELRFALTNAHKADKNWALKIENPSIMDYVNTAVKPSLLNNLQTMFYKISNYQQRKEIQQLCIGYLASSTPRNKMLKALKANLKFEQILNLMMSDKIQEFKDAVQQLKSNTVDQVSKQTGFATFELLYIQRSAANTKDAKDAKGTK